MSTKNSFEKELLTKVIDDGDIRPIRKMVTADHFLNPLNRQIWSFLQGHHAQHGVMPSREILAASFPKFEFSTLSDPVEVIAGKLHERYVYNAEALFMEEVAQTAKESPTLAAQMIADKAPKFRAMINAGKSSSGVDLTQQIREEMAEYYRRKECKGILGAPWPWPRMNKATFGIQDGQLILFYARPKNMKSWLLLYVLTHLYYNHGRKPVLFTREMTVEEMRHRVTALYAGVDYGTYLRGELTTMEERKWRESMEAFLESPPFIIDTVDSVGAAAADEMIAKAQDYGADIMGVDGLYLFGNREWDVIAEFTSRLKQHILNTYKIPCLGTSQGNRDFSTSKASKDSLADMGFADSLGQDCDVAIKVALSKEDKRIYLGLPAVREGESCDFQIWAKPAYDFSQAFGDLDNDQLSNNDELPPDPLG